jgi:N-acetylmuramoyl-L-alanine amidase
MGTLKNKEVALVVGHPDGEGAKGERAYNTEIAYLMADKLEKLGAVVYIHWHHISSYGSRQREMRRAVKEKLPECECCIELHYNAFYKESAHGHEFFYRGSRRLAETFHKHFSKAFEWSTARSGGVKPLMSGDGAGFLKEAPAWACLVEPFFVTNNAEKQFFTDHQDELAQCYVDSIEDFLINA